MEERRQNYSPEANLSRKELKPPVRIVPAFSVQTLQRNTKATKPPLARPREIQEFPKTEFRERYETGDLPVFLVQETTGVSLKWLVSIADLDYRYYLPFFVEGLMELEHPYNLIAELGCREMFYTAGEKILHALPYIIPFIDRALSTRHPIVLLRTFRVIQNLALSEAGPHLVDAYPKLLPTMFLFKETIENIGDEIDYAQGCLGTLANETLELLEKSRGPDAYHEIKKRVPTFESFLHNY